MEGYSVKEAASVLGVPKEKIWELLARGILAGTPGDGGSVRVQLHGRPSEGPAVVERPRQDEPTGRAPSGNGNGGDRGHAGFEASPFRELLTEFRNLTERYGQALLALGEARGEVASLRSRVDVLEARIDLRLPWSPPPVEWAQPEAGPPEGAASAPAPPAVDPEAFASAPAAAWASAPDGPASVIEEPVASVFEAEVEVDVAPEVGPSVEVDVAPEVGPNIDAEPPGPTAEAPPSLEAQAVMEQVESVLESLPSTEAAQPPAESETPRPRARRRRRGARVATEEFAQALSRAEDPTPAELPGADERGVESGDLHDKLAEEVVAPELEAGEDTNALGMSEAVAPAVPVELDVLLADEALGGTAAELPSGEAEPMVAEALAAEPMPVEPMPAEAPAPAELITAESTELDANAVLAPEAAAAESTELAAAEAPIPEAASATPGQPEAAPAIEGQPELSSEPEEVPAIEAPQEFPTDTQEMAPMESAEGTAASEPPVAMADELAETSAGASSEEQAPTIGSDLGAETPPTAGSRSDWDEPDWIAEEDFEWGSAQAGPQAQGAVALGESPEVGWAELPAATGSVAEEVESPLAEAEEAESPQAEAQSEAEAPEAETRADESSPGGADAAEPRGPHAGAIELPHPAGDPFESPRAEDAEPPAQRETEERPRIESSDTTVLDERTSAARNEAEEELMWLGDEFRPSAAPWSAQGRVTTLPRPQAAPRRVSPAEDEALARLAVERGWDDDELHAIRSLLAQPPRSIGDEQARAVADDADDEAEAADDAAADEAVAEAEAEDEALDWEQSPSAFNPVPQPRPSMSARGSLELPGSLELDEAMAAFEISTGTSHSGGQPPPVAAPPDLDDAAQGAAEPIPEDRAPTGRTWSKESSEPSPLEESGSADADWLRGRRGPAANAYRRLRRLLP